MKTMAEKKVVFVAFAIEDERQRDFLKGPVAVDEEPVRVHRHVGEGSLQQGVERARSYADPQI